MTFVIFIIFRKYSPSNKTGTLENTIVCNKKTTIHPFCYILPTSIYSTLYYLNFINIHYTRKLQLHTQLALPQSNRGYENNF